MSSKAIRAQLQEDRTATGANDLNRTVCCRLDRQDVHAVNRPCRHLVAGRLDGKVGLGLREIQRGAHGIEVVLATEEHRQLPQRRKVHRLVELPFGHGALTEETGRHLWTVLHVVGQCQPHCHGQSAGHDGAASVEATGDIEKVHRPASPTAAALHLAEHLGHDRRRRNATDERVTVLAIGRDHGVIGLQRLRHTDGDGLLADVEVHEAADLRRAVELDTRLLEAADAQHLVQQHVSMTSIDPADVHESRSRVERSPSGSPSSRALSRRRMILPLLVLGRC